MSFNQNKKYQTKIASQAAGDEDIYSLINNGKVMNKTNDGITSQNMLFDNWTT